MASETRIAVALALTPDPDLLPVVDVLVAGVATRLGFGKKRQRNLQRGVQQACRRLMEAAEASRDGEIHLDVAGFLDRLEIVLRDKVSARPSDKESRLLNQFIDRVSLEETQDGRARWTLVQYLEQP